MSRNTKLDAEAEALQSFRRDTADHQLVVVKDDGLHRHLRFRKPGTGCYGFDIVTWPGYLAITGDMGASMFSRLPDMLEFFRDDRKCADSDSLYINSGYWAEKCVANDGDKKEFKAELFETLVKDHFEEFVADHREDPEEGDAPTDPEWASDLWSDLQSKVLMLDDDSVRAAIEAMTSYEPDSDTGYARFAFSDAWEYANSLEHYTFHFLWRLYAIAHAVKAYDAQSVQA